EGLNHILGTRADNRPNVQFFTTYGGGGDTAGVTRLRLTVSTTDGLSVALITSPIPAVTFQVRDGHTWAVADLRTYGAFELEVPGFAYDGRAFRASGGFRTVRPLRPPLAPLRLLLSGAGLGDLARLLPESVPLNGLTVYDPQTGLNVKALTNAL